MNTLLIVLLVTTFGVIAYLLGQLPRKTSSKVGVAISVPAIIYFLVLATTQSGNLPWGTWLFVILALGIFLKSIMEIYKSRDEQSNLDDSR